MTKFGAITKNKTIRLFAVFLVFWIPAIIFAKLAGEVVEAEPIHLDIVILHWIHAGSNSFYDALFLIITTLGNVEILLPVTIAIIMYMIYKKHRLNALMVVFAVGGAGIANFVLKLLFHRDRPAFWHSAITETSYSFPSGHAMLSSALVLILICIAWKTRYRIVVTIIGLIFMGLIGFSRLYMGVHYPTDIIAGWMVSTLWVTIVFMTAKEVSFRFGRRVKK